MNLNRFLATWNRLALENRDNRIVILLLIGANIAHAITLNQTERTVVLVPPVLEGEVTVARSSASQEVKEAWTLFVAELLGNVSPTNSQFLRQALDPLLAPALRQDVLQVLDAQIGEIRRVKECFVIVGGFGDLGSERALLRSETLTYVRTDGGVIEVPLDAYAVGEDGKVGVRGRLVSKPGALLAKALQAGFLTSFAKVFTQVPSIPISTGGNQVQYQSLFTPQAAAAGAAGGAGGAMDRLADYYMQMAQLSFPVLEVDAGRAVELIVNKGVSLRLER